MTRFPRRLVRFFDLRELDRFLVPLLLVRWAVFFALAILLFLVAFVVARSGEAHAAVTRVGRA
jgi:hypothetical protein